MVAGALLLDEGALALQTHWAPATLALVHAFTLGMLGNAMFGSLLQFLPAAAGVRVRGGTRAGWALFGLLNAGTLLLVTGFRAMRTELLLAAVPTLALAFALLAAIALPGLLDKFRLLSAWESMQVPRPPPCSRHGSGSLLRCVRPLSLLRSAWR